MDQRIGKSFLAGFLTPRAIIWLALLCSIIANIILSAAGISLFTKLQFSRIFPLGYFSSSSHGNLESGAPDHDADKIRLLFVGDSRSQMWDVTGLGRQFHVRKIAHGGQTSAQVLLQVLTKKVPDSDWAILQVGINDIHPISLFKEYESTIIENCITNIDSIIRNLNKKVPRIVLTTIFPRSDAPLIRRPISGQLTNRIQLVNSHIREMNNKDGVTLLDAYKLLRTDEDRLKTEFVDDDFYLHVNSKAYGVLNKELINMINSSN